MLIPAAVFEITSNFSGTPTKIGGIETERV